MCGSWTGLKSFMMSRICCIHSLFLFKLYGVPGDLSPFLGQNFQVTFRITTMAPPMNICGGGDTTDIIISSVAMELNLSMEISMKLSSAKIYGGLVCSNWLLVTIGIGYGPNNSIEGGDVIWLPFQLQRQIQSWNSGTHILSHTRTRWWQRRRIFMVSVPADNTWWLSRRRNNWRRCWPSERQWQRLYRHNSHTYIIITNTVFTR